MCLLSESFVYDKNFVPAKPSLVLTSTVGNVTVVTKLYGPVSAERGAKERREIQYRVQQLQPVERRVIERPLSNREIMDEEGKELDSMVRGGGARH